MTNDDMILLVEDNRDDELFTLDALRKSGVTNPISVVRDGQEALDFLFCEGPWARRDAARKPCLVLLDLRLPKVSGRAVLRRIKTDDRTRRIPVVILTTSSQKEDIENCYGNGANGYVRKPVEFEEFVEAVRHLGLYWTLVNASPA
jgi:two-component system response regulator